MKAVYNIFIRELVRLDGISADRPLSYDELRKLNLITSSLKQYSANPIDDPDAAISQIENLTLEELLQLANINE
jgi:hypothetical protein